MSFRACAAALELKPARAKLESVVGALGRRFSPSSPALRQAQRDACVSVAKNNNLTVALSVSKRGDDPPPTRRPKGRHPPHEGEGRVCIGPWSWAQFRADLAPLLPRSRGR